MDEEEINNFVEQFVDDVNEALDFENVIVGLHEEGPYGFSSNPAGGALRLVVETEDFKQEIFAELITPHNIRQAYSEHLSGEWNYIGKSQEEFKNRLVQSVLNRVIIVLNNTSNYDLPVDIPDSFDGFV